jgi:hypothetical protein
MLKVGEDIFRDSNDDFSKGVRPSFNPGPSERTPMIEDVYLEVLGRKPSTRELSFYKYGAMNEADIRLKLLRSDEHVKMLEDAKKLPNVENELRNSKASERRLTQKIEDIGNEIVQSKILLDEKNVIIQELRENLNNPYDIPHQVQKYEEGFDVYQTSRKVAHTSNGKKTVLDSIKEIISILIK